MADFTPEEGGPQPGERIVFSSWLLIIAVGLGMMIAVPLLGR